MPDEEYKSTADFLQKMDSGALDQSLSTEMKKLTPVQLDELAQILMSRDAASQRPR
jgi:hypothetical protein